jgi:hypothetical protein
MMSLTSIAYAVALILSGQVLPATKPTRSVKVGEFLVTATRVWLPQDPSNKVPPNPSGTISAPLPAYPDRFHLVAVEVTVKNISERVSQTRLGPRLRVKPDAEYQQAYAPDVVKEPNLDQLLPGEESRGGYVFRIRNGTAPVALIPLWRRESSIDLTGMLEDKSAK